jgi:hypothetical protein
MTETAGQDGGSRSGVRPVAGVPTRGRGAVAASILGVLLIGAYFAAAPGGVRTPLGEYLLNAAILAVAFWFPAMRVSAVADVGRQWKGLLVWALAWTVVWDLATSGILVRRELFQEWWIVYPAGVLTLAILLLLHGAALSRVVRPGPGRPADRRPTDGPPSDPAA